MKQSGLNGILEGVFGVSICYSYEGMYSLFSLVSRGIGDIFDHESRHVVHQKGGPHGAEIPAPRTTIFSPEWLALHSAGESPRRLPAMPDRIIRTQCVSSKTLDRLSNGAERLFWRLVATADNMGRFEADEVITLATCFPLKSGKWRASTILSWLDELSTTKVIPACGKPVENSVSANPSTTSKSADCGKAVENSEKSDVPAIVRYRISGRTYGYLLSFPDHQRLRSKHSRFPEPPQDLINQALGRIRRESPQVAAIRRHSPQSAADVLKEEDLKIRIRIRKKIKEKKRSGSSLKAKQRAVSSRSNTPGNRKSGKKGLEPLPKQVTIGGRTLRAEIKPVEPDQTVEPGTDDGPNVFLD